MNIRARSAAVAAAAACAALSASLALPRAAAAQEGAPPPAPAISGIAAGSDGQLLVSPPVDGAPVVTQIAADGSLSKEWPFPEDAALEVVDADASGHPLGLDARAGKIWVLKEKGQTADWLILSKVKGIDKSGIAPLVRAAPNGEIAVAAGDGSGIWLVSIATGTAKKVAFTGETGGIGDIDVADDGRIAILDSVAGTLRTYAADGKLLWNVPVTAPNAPPNAYYAVVRFVPGSDDAWVMEMPAPGAVSPEGAPLSGLQLYDAKGERVLSVDHDPKGAPFAPAAGIAPVKDGVWMVDLAGNARKVDRKGAVLVQFDAAPPPPGMDWNEKRRLQKVAENADTASLPDAVHALAVVKRVADADALFKKVTGEGAAAEPLMRDATAKNQLPSALLAAFYDKTLSANRAALGAAFKDPAASVRAAAVAVLRDDKVTGFDAELNAAATDKAAPVRGGALVVLARHRWTPALAKIFLDHLKDDDENVAALASQALAARLADSVDALVGFILDSKQSTKARDLAGRALILDVPNGDRLPPLPAGKHAALRKLVASKTAGVKRIGALALLVHGDAAAPAAISSTWPGMTPEQRRFAASVWPTGGGDAGAQALIRLLAREKDPLLRPSLIRALHRNGGYDAKKWLMSTALKAGGNERDRAEALELAKRRLSDAQIVALTAELPKMGHTLREAVLRVAADRDVKPAAPKISAIAKNEDDRAAALAALYRIGSTDAVPMALETVKTGKATKVELSYLASVGGIPNDGREPLLTLAKSGKPEAILAAEALARSGDTTPLALLVEAVKADRYGGGLRDGNLPGALAAMGAAGRDAAKTLLTDPSPAAREDAALALAIQGGDACKDVVDWGKTDHVRGVAVPAAFYALSACGAGATAQEVFRKASENPRPGDLTAPTATADVFAALLAQSLHQPDFRPKADPVLAAVAGLPRPVVSSVAASLATELDPDVAGAALKYVYGALGPGSP